MVSAAFPNRPFNLRDNVLWVETDVSNNRSKVSFQLWIDKTGYSPTWSGSGKAARWLRLDGKYVHEYYGNTGFDFRGDGPWLLASGTTWIYHNSNGAKNLLIEAAADFEILGATSLSVTIGLPTIPRASTPSVVGGLELVPGTTYTINTNRASSGFTHTLQYNFGSVGLTTIATGIGTSTTWTPPVSLLNEIPNAVRGYGALRLITYSGGTQVGIKDIQYYLNVPSSYVPTIGSVTHEEATPGISANVGKYVKGLTTLNTAITNPAGVAGSTISSQKIEILNSSGTVLQAVNAGSGVTLPLSQSGTLTVKGTVTDSRGRIASKSVTIGVLDYGPPVLTAISVQRALSSGVVDEDEGTYLRVNIKAAISSLVNGTERNAMNYRISTRPYEGTTWTQKSAGALSGTSVDTYKVVGTYSVTQSFEVLVEVYDDFATSAVVITVPVAAVFMHWDGSLGVGIGKFREQGALDVAGDIYSRGFIVLSAGDFATDAEANQGVITNKPVTPANIKTRHAQFTGSFTLQNAGSGPTDINTPTRDLTYTTDQTFAAPTVGGVTVAEPGAYLVDFSIYNNASPVGSITRMFGSIWDNQSSRSSRIFAAAGEEYLQGSTVVYLPNPGGIIRANVYQISGAARSMQYWLKVTRL